MNTSSKVRAAALLSVLLASTASSGAVIALSPLPNGEITTIPGHAPAHIGAGERVSGVFVARAPIQPNSRNYKRFEIVDTRKDAESFASKGYVENQTGRAPKRCVFTTDDTATAGEPWPALARGEIATFEGSGQKPIVGVHVEALEDGSTPGHPASLDVMDAWLDTRTGGLKLVAKATVPLGIVAEGPHGIRVLAAHSGDTVHFVVLPPSAESSTEAFEAQIGRAIIESGGEVGVSQCRHTRLSLEARPGTGEHAVVTFQHVVKTKPDPSDEKTNDPGPAVDFTTSRTQLIQVHLSASRNAGASVPVVSVSFRVDRPKPFGA